MGMTQQRVNNATLNIQIANQVLKDVRAAAEKAKKGNNIVGRTRMILSLYGNFYGQFSFDKFI
jgi:hypothetical protein